MHTPVDSGGRPDVGYCLPVSIPTVTGLVAATYVRDLDRSRRFYGALGFQERSTGSNDEAAWSSLHHGDHSVLLVSMTPGPDLPALPLLLYFYVDDLAVATARLQETGTTVTHVGYPPHVPGGEARTTDPDGNTILLGQREALPQVPADDPAQRFSLLREAAALARQLADPDRTCQIGGARGEPCPRPAELKLADSWGTTAWACLPHADDTLINARSVFIASHGSGGLDSYLTKRSR
jgi:predicted enzyme related to lactoylglutathione lyase